MIRILGIDPGGTTGLAVLEFHEHTEPPWHIEPSEVVGKEAMSVLTPMLRPSVFTAVAIEKFVVSRRSGRSRTAGAGETARNIVGAVKAFCSVYAGIPVIDYTASQVKEWATDRRLEVAGLIKPTRGLGHARDAARHALYTAHWRCGRPDPLSTRERT